MREGMEEEEGGNEVRGERKWRNGQRAFCRLQLIG